MNFITNTNLALSLLFFSSLMTSTIHANTHDPKSKPTPSHNELEEVVKNLVELEIAGWRLPSPNQLCIKKVSNKHFAIDSSGLSEGTDPPISITRSQLKFKLLEIKTNKEDPGIFEAKFTWNNKIDELSFIKNGEALVKTLGKYSPLASPKNFFVLKECL
jgi:hypothetical protein